MWGKATTLASPREEKLDKCLLSMTGVSIIFMKCHENYYFSFIFDKSYMIIYMVLQFIKLTYPVLANVVHILTNLLITASSFGGIVISGKLLPCLKSNGMSSPCGVPKIHHLDISISENKMPIYFYVHNYLGS